MRSNGRLAALLSALLLTACVAVDAPLGMADPESEQTQWQQQGLTAYSFTVERRCYCLPDYVRPIRVSVDNGAVVKAVYASDGQAVSENIRKELRSMTQWLHYADELEAKNPYSLNVQVDAEIGYLRRLDVDHHRRIADDELTVIITDFQAD